MSIRQRKKHIFKASILGGLVVFIPLMIVIILLSYVLYNNNKELDKHKKIEKESVIYYRLSKDMSKDERITQKDINEVSVSANQRKLNTIPLSDIIGKRVKLDLSKDTLLTKDLIYEGEKLEADLRLQNYNYIHLEDKIVVGDYVDIRITFPNGADFILLSKKKVLDYSIYNSQTQTDNALWLEVSEEEILRLSSAVVDAYHIEGCKIYAILYVEETQDPSVVTYPANQIVKDLMKEDPNIISKASNVLAKNLRKELELEELYRSQGEVSQTGQDTYEDLYNKDQSTNDSRDASLGETNLDDIEYVD